MLLDFDWTFLVFLVETLVRTTLLFCFVKLNACYKTKNQVETSLKVSIVETSLLGDTHLKVIESDSDTLYITIKGFITNNDKLEVVESLMTGLGTFVKPLNNIVLNLMSGSNEKLQKQ